MSKESKKVIPENPFAAFSLVKGEFSPPISKEEDEELTEDIEDDVVSGKDKSIIEEDLVDLDEEAKKLEAGNKVIEENIRKQEAIAKAKLKGKQEEVLETETEEESEDSEEGDETSVFKAFTEKLHSEGVIDFDHTDEEFEDSEEGLGKLVGKTLDKRWNDRYSKLPHDAKVFLDFVEKGGDPKEFMSIYYNEHTWEEFKLDNEDAYKLAISESLRLQGENPEDIEDMILEWELSGSLEKRAKPALSRLKKFESEQKEAILKRQEQETVAAQKAQQEFWDGFKKNLMSKEEIKGFKLTPKVKENLLNFMTQVDKKTGKTGYQLAVENDNDASLLFALQAMNGFDIKKLESQVDTKAAGKLSKILKNIPTDTKTKMSSGRPPKHENEDPFELFKKSKN